jgi:hypothetical protein
VKALTVLMYVLGLSYGAVSDVMEALGCGISKTTVYNNVQAGGETARRRQADTVVRGGSRAVIGSDGTYVKVKGEQRPIDKEQKVWYNGVVTVLWQYFVGRGLKLWAVRRCPHRIIRGHT